MTAGNRSEALLIALGAVSLFALRAPGDTRFCSVLRTLQEMADEEDTKEKHA